MTGRKDYFQTYKRPELGDVLYKDMNGDGTLDDNDRIKRGHGTAPRFSMISMWDSSTKVSISLC